MRWIAVVIAVVTALVFSSLTWIVFALAMIDLMIPTSASGMVAIVVAAIQLICVFVLWRMLRRGAAGVTIPRALLAGAAAGIFIRLCTLQPELLRETFR